MKFFNFIFIILVIYFCFPGYLYAQEEDLDLSELSLEELLNVKIDTASKHEQTSREAPSSVTIITSEEIERYGWRTLAEILMSVRGLYITDDHNYTYLGIRGFSRPTDYNNRLLLLINGHTMNENFYGSAYIGNDLGLPMDSIERIEIVRGPGSALYGTGAMFAVINIITKEGNDLNGFRLSGETGSWERRKGSLCIGKKLQNGLDYFVSGVWGEVDGDDLYFEEYDQPETNYGIAEGLDWEKYYGLNTSLTFKDFSLLGHIASREKGVPTAAWEMEFNNNDAQSLDERQFVEIKYEKGLTSDKEIMLRGFYDCYHYEGTYPYEDVYWHDANDGQWIGGEFQFRWDIKANNRLIIGSEYTDHLEASYKNKIGEEVSFDEDFPCDIFSLYLQDEYQILKDLSLTLGIHWDDYSTTGSSVTPRGALVYHPFPSSTFKILFGEAYRTPNEYEVSFEDLIFAKGNPDLKRERIRTFEMIWEQQLSADFFGTISLFHNEMKDLIDPIVDPEDNLTQFQNISKAKANGAELELQTRLKNGLLGRLSYTYQKVEDTKTKEELSNSPNHLVKLNLSSDIFKHFYISGEFIYETERITVYRTETDSFLLTNLNLSTKQLFDRFKLSLLVRNLFDEEYKLPGGFEHIQDGIIQEGRNFTVKLAIKI